MNPTRRTVALSLAAGPLLAGRASAQPAPYPDRTVKIVVAYSAGGANDVVARLLADGLRERLGGSFVVENRAGAGGSIGTTAAARSAPDGTTLLLGAGGAMTINPSLYANLAYDPEKDFEPISLIATSSLILVVNPGSPFRTVPEIVAAAKAKDGGLTYASAGIGTPLHLAAELFRSTAGVPLTHAPYQGTSGALTDLMGGRVDIMFDVVGTSLPLVRNGDLRAVGVTSAARNPIVPDIPTIAEQGMPDYEITVWYGLFAPRGTPAPIVAKLNASLGAILSDPATREKLIALGFEATPSTSDALRDLVRREIPRWAGIVKAAAAPR